MVVTEEDLAVHQLPSPDPEPESEPQAEPPLADLALPDYNLQNFRQLNHTVRQPLSVCLGLTEMLLDTPLLPSQKRHVESLGEQLQSIKDTLSGLLDLVQQGCGLARNAVDVFDLYSTVEDVVHEVQASNKYKQVCITLEDACKSTRMVTAQEGKMRQMLTSILQKCCTTLDQSRIAVSLKLEGDEAFQVCTRVQATEAHSLLQGNHLALSQALASDLGGKLTVEPELSASGHVLVITFSGKARQSSIQKTDSLRSSSASLAGNSSRASASAEALSSSPTRSVSETLSGASETEPSLKTAKVLIVDDISVNRSILEARCKRHGLTDITMAEDGQKALNCLQASKYDIVFMDIQMPVMDGVQATQAVRKGEKGVLSSNRHVPIVAVTAHHMDEERDRCIAAGFTHFLTKPLADKTFVAVLKDTFSSTSSGVPREPSFPN
jgi:CheY-like chemotaxis protein